MFSHSCEKIFVFFTIRKLKLLVAIYTVENGPFIKKSNLFFFFSKFTRIIAVLKWFPAVRWLFSRLLKLKSPLVSLVAFKLLEPGKQPTHSWKPFSHGKISKSVEKKKNKVLFHYCNPADCSIEHACAQSLATIWLKKAGEACLEPIQY